MMLKNILQWSIVIGICLLLITPLIVTPSLFFPFITGKAFFFRIIVGMITGLWLVLMVIDKDARPKSSPVLWSVLSLALIATLAAWFGINPSRSIWSNFERMEGLIGLWHVFALFLVTSSTIVKRQWWRLLVRGSLVISAGVSLYALVQLFGWLTINQGGVRVDATFGNTTYLAVYLLFNIFLILVCLTRVWQIAWQRYVLGALLALQLIIIYNTATRGAILGLIGGLILTGILIACQYSGQPRKWIIGSMVILVLLVGGFVLVRDTELVKNSPVLSRFASISVTDTTTQSRLLIWKMSLNGFAERPLLGWGQENYAVVFNKYFDPKLWRQEAWFDRAHNVLLDWLVSTGILGLVSYLSLFVSALWILWRRLPVDSLLGSPLAKNLTTGLLAAYFFQNLFVFDNLISYVYFFLLLAYLHQASQLNYDSKTKSNAPIKPLAWVGIAVIVALSLGAIYKVNAAPLKTGRGLIQALVSQPDPKQNLGWFQKTVNYQSPIGDREVREQLLSQAEALARNERLTIEERQAFLAYAFKQMEEVVKDNPEDARLALFMGSFLGRFGKSDQATVYLEQALKLSPNKQSILFAIASNYIVSKDYVRAESVFKQAYELDPDYLEARKYYGLILLMNGKIQAARDLLVPVYGSIAVPDPQFINWFAETRQYNLVLEAWQKLAPANPNNAQYQFALAAAYLAVGRRADSIATIEKIIAISPSHKEQGESLIRQIRAGQNPLEI